MKNIFILGLAVCAVMGLVLNAQAVMIELDNGKVLGPAFTNQDIKEIKQQYQQKIVGDSSKNMLSIPLTGTFNKTILEQIKKTNDYQGALVAPVQPIKGGSLIKSIVGRLSTIGMFKQKKDNVVAPVQPIKGGSLLKSIMGTYKKSNF